MRFSLQFSLLTVTVATVLLTALAVDLPWSYTADANLSDMARQLNAQVIAGVRRQVQDEFEAADADQDAIVGLIQSGAIDLASQRKRDALFLSFLKTNPYYSFVAVGMPDGDFYGAQRLDAHHLAAITSRWNKATRKADRSERQYIGDGRTFVPYRTVDRTNAYFAPDRQWFTLATRRPGHDVLTDAYLFANTHKPGVNTAIAVLKGHTLYGVVTIAIELDRLSRYLHSLTIGKTGTAFILNSTGHLIAARDPGITVAPVGDASQQAPLGDLSSASSPLLHVAHRAIVDHAIRPDRLTRTREVVQSDAGQRYFVTLAPADHNGWIIGTVIPEQDFTGRILANRKKLLLALALTLLVTCLLAVQVARRLFIKPMGRILDQIRHVERFELADVRYAPSRILEIDELSSAVKDMSAGLTSFGKYLPTGLVKTLFASGIGAELSGERRTMTIFFMDLAGFTTISEAMGPQMVPPLAAYLGLMSDIVEAERGTIDKYIGDAVMAFWGAPHHLEEHASLACRAALACLSGIGKLREQWPEPWRDKLQVRIGINTGRVTVGNIGSASRLNYTVIGDPVNLASRLEGTCKIYGVDCIIGQNTFELAKYEIVARRLDTTTVKGRLEPVAIYELLAMADDEVPPGHFDWVRHYEEALERFERQDWAGAQAEFFRVIEERGGDPPSELMVGRCVEHRPELADLAF